MVGQMGGVQQYYPYRDSNDRYRPIIGINFGSDLPSVSWLVGGEKAIFPTSVFAGAGASAG